MKESARSRIFVYGTLKRGGSNHHLMDGQRFLGEARTVPGFALYEIEAYPAMIREAGASEGVRGEIWEVDGACLERLDVLEGIDEGLYERVEIPLAPPFDSLMIEGYLFLPTLAGRRRLGAVWPA